MTIRPATCHDHHDAIAWLRPDDPERGVRVLVEEVNGQLVGTVLRVPNPVHPQLDHLGFTLVGDAPPRPRALCP